MEEEGQKSPLIVATAIAVGVMVLFVFGGRVDLHSCQLEWSTNSEQASSSTGAAPEVDRTLRLWLDAGDLEDALREALDAELAAVAPRIKLTDAVTPGARVTIRVDDASFYTPFVARGAITALMTFESGAQKPGGSRITGESRVELNGACYGIVSPTGFAEKLSGALAKPFAQALTDALP